MMSRGLAAWLMIMLLAAPIFTVQTAAADVTRFTELRVINATENIYSVAWSPDGTKIVSAPNPKVWDASTGAKLMALEGQNEGVGSISWWPDGSKILSSSWYGTVVVWNAATGALISNFTGQISGLASLSPDGLEIASAYSRYENGSWKYGLNILNSTTGANVSAFTGHSEFVSAIAWSADGKRLASGSADRSVRILDAVTGENLKTLTGHTDWVYTVAWSPDGSTVASGGAAYDRTIRFWNATSGAEVRKITGFPAGILSVAWSPDGRLLASGDAAGPVRVWDAATGDLKANLTGHEWNVTSVAWSPDGTRIVSGGSYDKTIRIWGEGGPAPPTANPNVAAVRADRTSVKAGDNVTVTATIGNNGTADASNVEVKFYDGTALLATRYVDVPRNGTSIAGIQWVTNTTTPPGSHNLRVIVGTSEKSVTVTVTNASAPNLFISSVRTDRTSLKAGDNVTITATIGNNGMADASNAEVKFYDGTMLLATRYANVAKGGTNSTYCEWVPTSATAKGAHTIRVVAGGSEGSVVVTVDGAGLPVDVARFAIYGGKNRIHMDEPVNLTATLINNGTADASGVEVRFYDGTALLHTTRVDVPKGGVMEVSFIWAPAPTARTGDHELRVETAGMNRTVHVTVVEAVSMGAGDTTPSYLFLAIGLLAAAGAAIAFWSDMRRRA